MKNFEKSIYTQKTSKIGFGQCESCRNSSILNDLIFLILGHLGSANGALFGAAENPTFEVVWVYPKNGEILDKIGRVFLVLLRFERGIVAASCFA